MKRISTVATLLLASCFSMPAHADWQYTKWGMTPAQVKAASKGAASEFTPDTAPAGGDTQKLSAPYSTDVFTFQAKFYFDQTDKLTEVILELQGGDPSALIGALRGKYGKTIRETGGSISGLQWQTSTDRVSLLTSAVKTIVGYTPLHRAGEKGL